MTVRAADGAVERSYLDADAIERALRDICQLPPDPAWRPAIEAAAATQWDAL